MCERCEMRKEWDDAYYQMGEDVVSFFGNDKHQLIAKLYLDKEEPIIEVDVFTKGDNDVLNIKEKIKYCPYCGREL